MFLGHCAKKKYKKRLRGEPEISFIAKNQK